MKTKLFISFAAFAAASVLMSSCSNEESTAATDQLTAFTGGIVTEVPMERVQIGTPGVTTRTSMNRNEINGDGSFLWEPGDVIYVEDDGGKLYKSQNAIQDAAPALISWYMVLTPVRVNTMCTIVARTPVPVKRRLLSLTIRPNPNLTIPSILVKLAIAV